MKKHAPYAHFTAPSFPLWSLSRKKCLPDKKEGTNSKLKMFSLSRYLLAIYLNFMLFASICLHFVLSRHKKSAEHQCLCRHRTTGRKGGHVIDTEGCTL